MLKQILGSLILTSIFCSFLAAAPVVVSIKALFAKTSPAEVKVPVYVTDVTGLSIVSADLVVEYDQTVLEAKDTTLDGTIAEGSNIQQRIDNDLGRIDIGIIGVEPLSGDGVLVFIIFDVVSTDPDASSPLSIVMARLNEDEVETDMVDGDISLPVVLSSFVALADLEKKNAILRWQVETEIDNVGFTIYRSEQKEGPYTEIGWVESKGNTGYTRRYQFVDTTAQAETYFYQLEFISLTAERERTDAIKFDWSEMIRSLKTIQIRTTWGRMKAVNIGINLR